MGEVIPLRSVPAGAALPACQLLLRPVIRFVEVALEEPLRARRARRRAGPAHHRRGCPLLVRRICARQPLFELPEDIGPVVPAPRHPSATRSRRAGQRPVSLGTGSLTDDERTQLAKIEHELAEAGVTFGPPATFGDCKPGPCPHASCRYNLLIDVIPPRGPSEHLPVVKANFPGKDPDEIPETCALRAANAGEAFLEVVGQRLNITEARAEQVEKRALAKIRAYAEAHGWSWRDLWAALMGAQT